MADKMKKPDVRLEINGVKYGGWTKISIRRGIGRSPVHSSFRSPSAGRGSRSLRKSSSGPHASLPLTALPSLQDTSTTWLRRITRPRTRYPSPGATRPAIWWIAARPRRSSKARRSRPWPGRLRPRSASRWSTKRASASSPGFKTNPGDTVFETLEQLARAKGVLLTTDGRGRLVICRASKKKAATVLELGKNVFEGKGKFSMRDRFSSVTVIGQTAATETWNGKSASQQKTVVTDAAVPRHRPLVLVADQEHQGANKRAQWEVNVRYGKGNQATYTVYGWKDGDALWTPNVLVRIVDPFMGLEATWLVGSVGWTLDERGYRSELTLNPPEAFDVEPVSPKKGKKDKETFRWPGADTKES